MGRNGSKTRKLRMQQGCRDLDAINRRLEGLAENFSRHRKQCSQNREKLVLDLKKARGGSRLKRTDLLRGFLKIFARHKKQQG